MSYDLGARGVFWERRQTRHSQIADTEKNGYINRNELTMVMANIGEKLAIEEIQVSSMMLMRSLCLE